MKFVTTLLGAAALVGAGILVERARHRRLMSAAPGGLGAGTGDRLRSAPVMDADLVEHMGIAEVDPEPLAQVAGEGIDPDANQAARRRTPLPRKNVP
jgi:hypothetical protein